MSPSQTSPLSETDFEAIESAVMETARGRWFLREYARRHRTADTRMLVDAIGKLGSAMARSQAMLGEDRIRMDLKEMAEAIARTKQEIASISSPDHENDHITEASLELDAIVNATESATSDILGAAEKIQEIAWSLRESAVDDAVCDQLDALATDIYMACSFQDITGQRTGKVIQVLQFLESRIDIMAGIWGDGDDDHTPSAPADTGPADPRPDAHLLNGPALEGSGMNQTDIDTMMSADDQDSCTGGDCPGFEDLESVSFDAIEPGMPDDTGVPEMEATASQTTTGASSSTPDFDDLESISLDTVEAGDPADTAERATDPDRDTAAPDLAEETASCPETDQPALAAETGMPASDEQTDMAASGEPDTAGQSRRAINLGKIDEQFDGFSADSAFETEEMPPEPAREDEDDLPEDDIAWDDEEPAAPLSAMNQDNMHALFCC